MNAKFITAKGSQTLTSAPYYIGIVQHERTMSAKETYAYCAEKTGFTPTQVRAAFMAMAEYIRVNQGRGNITFVDEVASIRNYVTGAFEGLTGPWIKGKNLLVVKSVEMDPFKSIVSDATLVNNLEGAKPVINTVFDDETREYGEIRIGNVFSIAGADLAPDATKSDEYVALLNDMGTIVCKAAISYSDLQNVKGVFEDVEVDPGEYTLIVCTRSGMGDEYGVKSATRKVTVK